MRIVTYEEMKQLPAGTVFYRYDQEHLYDTLADGPLRKHYQPEDPADIFYCGCGPKFNYNGYDKARPFDHFMIDNTGTREGLFDPDMLYLVLSPEDVELLIRNLRGTITNDEESFCGIPEMKA